MKRTFATPEQEKTEPLIGGLSRNRRKFRHPSSNSAILSRLLTKYEASGNAKALALIKKLSPAAWRHVHLNGHYTFRGDGQLIDLDAIVAGLELG
jgi:hypothetical protein